MRSRDRQSKASSPIYWPKLALPAALTMAAALLSLAAVDEAAAQGMRYSSFRGNSMGSMGAMRGPATMHRPMTRPNALANVAATGPFTTGVGKGKGKGGSATNPGRYPGGKNTGPGRPGGKYPDAGRYPDGKNPGTIGRIPRWPPRVPGGPGVIVAVPSGGPPSGGLPPSNFSGGGQPPSGPANIRPAGSGVPPANERRFVPNEVVIELVGTPSNQVVDALARRHRLVRLQSMALQLTNSTMYRWRIPDRRTVPAVIRALEADGFVVNAQPNFLTDLSEARQPRTASYDNELEQYALAKLQLPQAHTIARGAKVLIAVIDGGVDLTHPELAGTIVDSFDAIGSGDKVHPHGTAVVGAIVAQARLKGTAPAAQILAVRAFGASRDSSQGTTFHITAGIDWAVTRGARIINMSFAGVRDPKILRHLAIARERGIVLIAAAGNEGPKAKPAYPAADPIVIAVTATDEDDNLFHAANRGPHIAVAAPGVDLLLPAPGNTYKMTSGTSFSAALISGAVALLLERKPDLDPEAVRRILTSTARDLGTKGVDPQFGAGLVDAYRAVLSLEPPKVDTVTAAEPTVGTGNSETPR